MSRFNELHLPPTGAPKNVNFAVFDNIPAARQIFIVEGSWQLIENSSSSACYGCTYGSCSFRKRQSQPLQMRADLFTRNMLSQSIWKVVQAILTGEKTNQKTRDNLNERVKCPTIYIYNLNILYCGYLKI